jgi:hypothetical protein
MVRTLLMLEDGKCLDRHASWVINSLIVVLAPSAEVDSIFARNAVDNSGEAVVTAKSVLVVKAAAGGSVLKSVSQNSQRKVH